MTAADSMRTISRQHAAKWRAMTFIFIHLMDGDRPDTQTKCVKASNRINAVTITRRSDPDPVSKTSCSTHNNTS